MRLVQLMLLLPMVAILNGCVFTKVVTMPMRVGGAVISVIPGVGNTVDDAIDTAADKVDDLPI